MKRLFVIALLLSAYLPAQTLSTYNVSTVAGSAIASIGDGSNAYSALLLEPRGVVTDAAGNIYIADYQEHRVRKITKDPVTGVPVISTIAGTGRGSNSNTAGPGPTVPLNQPASLALDETRHFLYIAAQGAHVVKKLDLVTGVMTTLAGTGSSGYTGDGRLATAARLRNPRAVAVDKAGNVYIADTRNNRIRKVYVADAPSTGAIIRTVAGIGPPDSDGFFTFGDGGLATRAGLANPEGVAVDSSGNIYISDTQNHRVRKVDTTCTGCADTKGIISTVAGSCVPNLMDNKTGLVIPCIIPGSISINTTKAFDTVSPPFGTKAAVVAPLLDGVDPLRATLNSPRGLAFNANGDLLIADTGTNRIRIMRKVVGSGGQDTFPTILTFAGCCVTPLGLSTTTGGFNADGQQGQRTILSAPRGVTVDPDGNTIIAETGAQRIRIVRSSGLVESLAGTPQFGGDGLPATQAIFSAPRGVAVDSTGNIYISDTNNHRIRKISAVGGVVSTIGGTGVAGSLGDTGPATAAQLRSPSCLAVASSGAIFFADTGNNRVRKIDPSGTISVVAGAFLLPIAGADVLVSGDEIGNPLLATHARLSGPQCVALDNMDNLYIADTGNHVIRLVRADGTTSIVAGTLGASGTTGDGGSATEATLNGPQGVAVDPLGKYLYISDTGNHVIRRVSLSDVCTTGGCAKIIDTITGIFSSGDSDGTAVADGKATLTAASSARINTPVGLVADAAGNVFIADSSNNRIVRVDSAGNTGRIAGGGTTAFPDAEGKAAYDSVLFTPRGIAIDGTGNVYFTDLPGTIKKLTPVPVK